jgi:hypothetical protein
MRLGKVGMLVAPGGSGKSYLLLQLAVCVILGSPWARHFKIPDYVTGRRVLLVFGEEDADSFNHRLVAVFKALKVLPEERALVRQRLRVFFLDGIDTPLIESDDGFTLQESVHMQALRNLCNEGEGYALVGIDPVVQFAGPINENDNAQVTRLIKAVASLTLCKGNPAVLLPHHVPKSANGTGDVEARGASAFTCNARYVAGLVPQEGHVVFKHKKGNYSPLGDDVILIPDALGVLSVADAMTMKEIEAAEIEAEANRRASSPRAKVKAVEVEKQEAAVQEKAAEIEVYFRQHPGLRLTGRETLALVRGDNGVKARALAVLTAQRRLLRENDSDRGRLYLPGDMPLG